MGSVASVSSLSGRLNACLLQCCRKRSFLREHATPHGLYVWGTGVEFGWTAWQKGVGCPGPIESSLLYASEESWLAGSHLLMPLHLWVLAGWCPSRERLCRAVGQSLSSAVRVTWG